MRKVQIIAMIVGLLFLLRASAQVTPMPTATAQSGDLHDGRHDFDSKRTR